MLTALAILAAAPLVALWAAVVMACATDALAPEPQPEPVPFQRTYAVDRYRAAREATHRAQLCAWADAVAT